MESHFIVAIFKKSVLKVYLGIMYLIVTFTSTESLCSVSASLTYVNESNKSE